MNTFASSPSLAAPPAVPSGWFVVAHVGDLAPGATRTLQRFGTELVLFRTTSGRLSLVDATCPHLGAHLGHGGRVVGETLQCPFHGFRFDAGGRCTHAGPGATPPRKARLGVLPLVEREGLVFAWHGASGEPPSFALPALDAPGWPTLRLRREVVDAHPQDTTENSVDLAHFAHVHGYDEVRVERPLQRDGARLTIQYAATRVTGPLRTPVTFTYDVEVHGLGLSRVRVDVGAVAQCDLLVLASPIDAQRSDVWLGARVRAAPRAPRWVAAALGPFASSLMATILANDVRQDARIWSHKRWVHPPVLSAADGPIGPYRAWARQFQPHGTVTARA